MLAGLLVAVLAAAATAEPSLLPPLQRQQGPGSHWTLARTVDADATFRLDRTVSLQPDAPSLKLEVASAGKSGYAELRVHPFLKLKPGKRYVFSVWVRGHSAQRPYVEIYGFDAQERPTRLGITRGPTAGHYGWQFIEAPFEVPDTAVSVRLGMGIARGGGEVWFADPRLQLAEQATAESIVADSFSRKPDESEAWHAQWIWVQDPYGERQVTFRREIELDGAPASAIVQVTADDSYELRINGELVGLDTDWRTTELYDVTKQLRNGRNEIELVVVNFGGPGGALLQAAAFYDGGRVEHFGTDGNWSSSVVGQHPPTQTMEIGTPPTEPWGQVPFISYQPPKILNVQLLESVPPLEPGDALRLTLRLPQSLEAQVVDRFKLSFLDARTAKAHPLSAVPARFALEKGDVLTVEIPVSRFAGAGDYLWRIEGGGYVLTPPSDAFRRVTVLASDHLPEPAGTTWPGTRVRSLTVEGRQAPAVVYSTMTPSAQRFINWQVTGAHLYEIYQTLSLIWTGPDAFDIEPLERELLEILEADPLASVYLKLTVDAPSWWLKQHPDDRFVSSGGWTGFQSFASDAWRRDVADGVVTIINQLRQRPVGRYVVGFIPLAFRGGEFQIWGEDSGEYDVSPVAKAAFAQWQRDHGYDDLIELPHPALKMPFQPGARNAEVRRRFFRFVADRASGNLVYLAQRIKQQMPDLSIAMYYGYLTEHAVRPHRLLFAGHLGIERVLREAPIDMIGCPASYEFRDVNQPISFMNPEGAAALHGITPLIENDIRTHLAYSEEPGASKGLLTSFLAIEKLRLLAASRGAGVRYLALFNTVDFFQSLALLHHTAEWNQIVQTLEPNPPGANGEIALLLDPAALTSAAELPDMATMMPTFLHKIRDPLARTGRPYTILLMNDWIEHADTWETVVVPLPALLSDKARGALVSAFGSLPPIKETDGVLVLSNDSTGSFVSSDLHELRDRLATPEAKAAGPDTIWYVGGNFTARITGTRVHLERR
ncbi:MAG TPA: carbohydrate binding domain-containing protein [Phycisphaeraceae bacterium]